MSIRLCFVTVGYALTLDNPLASYLFERVNLPGRQVSGVVASLEANQGVWAYRAWVGKFLLLWGDLLLLGKFR